MALVFGDRAQPWVTDQNKPYLLSHQSTALLFGDPAATIVSHSHANFCISETSRNLERNAFPEAYCVESETTGYVIAKYPILTA